MAGIDRHLQCLTFALLILTSSVLLRYPRFLMKPPSCERMLFCYDVFQKQALFLLGGSSGNSSQCLCDCYGQSRLGSGLSDTLRICLDPGLFLRSLIPLGVPDSECYETSSKLRQTFTPLSFSCWLNRKEACSCLARFAPFLAYSARRMWVG
ncbi:hypothetical protein Tco_1397404 [Tanacetum coccineum]